MVVFFKHREDEDRRVVEIAVAEDPRFVRGHLLSRPAQGWGAGGVRPFPPRIGNGSLGASGWPVGGTAISSLFRPFRTVFRPISTTPESGTSSISDVPGGGRYPIIKPVITQTAIRASRGSFP